MSEQVISYPNEAVQTVADRLMDRDYNLPGDEALEIARDIVIDVTRLVDQLRAIEAPQPKSSLERTLALLLELRAYEHDGWQTIRIQDLIHELQERAAVLAGEAT